MQYRKLSKDMPPVSVLGFGCMRFYRQDGSLDLMSKDKPVDIELAGKQMDKAYEMGVNYYDTAYTYLGGMSEEIVGQHFKDRRNQVFIATKLPVWKAKKKEDYHLFITEQLNRLQTDYIDYYLVHSLTGETWKNALDLDILDFLDAIKASGRVRSIGFSFHDLYKYFEPILYAYPWDFCQIQLNYLDTEYQAGIKGMEKAHKKGMGVISMEPLLGGKLAVGLPQKAEAIVNEALPKRTPAEWALRWVWNFPQIAILLSGMNTLEQVVENCTIANNAFPLSMKKEELEIIDQLKTFFDERVMVHCATCAYCMPCPKGVSIPKLFTLYNEAHRFDDPNSQHRQYKALPEDEKASRCIACKICEEKCPHHLPIAKLMKELEDYFEKTP
jgi:uncharacterized protein